MKNFLLAIGTTLLFAACSNNGNEETANGTIEEVAGAEPAAIRYSIVNVYPHDTAAFTEGLLVHNGQLYESTGGQAQFSHFKSWFGPVDLKTGKAIRKIMLDTSYFGEGINIFKDKIYQLTWQNHRGFVYDAKTFKKIKEFTYNGEGWALTNDGTHLIMSDGSSNLQYLDPETLRVIKILGVQDNNGPVSNINELEYINGFIYANQYLTNYILKIDPASGRVVGKVDFSALNNELKAKYPNVLEMNGIAYDSATQRIYVTGKAWPNLYEVKFN
ncbi:MAG TPA: glutaminyl-peptide cyclotransferase [Chitinophagaceae bacterium]|jgi:glutamine cyclotransferase|nr:glutaminyl-peptide cyclotransferase [Chitinophagaceae bacterium]